MFIMIILCGSSVSFYIALNSDFQLLELCDIEDSESEKETKEHEETQDKKISSAFVNKSNFSLNQVKNTVFRPTILTNLHLEIQTPPPESLLT